MTRHDLRAEQVVPTRHALRGEQGLAMFTAIALTLIVLGVLVSISIATIGQSSQQRNARARLASIPWAESAVSDLEFRLVSRQIGRQNPLSESPFAKTPSTATGYELWAVPTEAPAGIATTKQTAVWSATGRPAPLNQAYRVTLVDGSGATHIGYYQILSPIEGDASKINKGLYKTGSPFPSKDWGSLEFVIRGWEDSVDGQKVANPRPVVLKAVFRQQSLSRYALLSDDGIHFAPGSSFLATSDGFPTRIHSNNIDRAGNGMVVEGNGNVSIAGQKRLTTSYGGCVGISGCKTNQRDIVDFPSIQEAYYGLIGVGRQEVKDPASGGPSTKHDSGEVDIPSCENASLTNVKVYHGIACRIVPDGAWYQYPKAGQIPDPLQNPYFHGETRTVEIIMEGDHLRYRIVMWPTRRDVGGLPFNNDLLMIPDTYAYKPIKCSGCNGLSVPRVLSEWKTFYPPPGGAGVLSTYDITLSGTMDCRHPVTIQSLRTNWSRNMNIYLWQRTGNAIGGQCPEAPVGIIAQGSILVPSFTLNASKTAGDRTADGYGAAGGGTNNNLNLTNVAMTTEGGFFGIGNTALSYFNGMDPCEAQLNTDVTNDLPQSPGFQSGGVGYGYGRGTSVTVRGSMALRRGLQLYYGNGRGDCWIGYQNRRYQYVSRLSWDPPPFYPASEPWHLSDWREMSNV